MKIKAATLLLGAVGMFTTVFSSSTQANGTLLNAPLISQKPELNNGCEVTSLAMMLQYGGVPVGKMTLAHEVAKDLTPYRKVGNTIYWGNPNTGFVGDITGRSIGYAVYHGPIYALANKYTNAIDITGQSFKEVTKQLDRGKPVWVISTSIFDTVPWNEWQTIQTPTGPLTMTFREHSVLLTGYDSTYVYFNDPLANVKNRRVSKAAFIRGWEQFGRQAVTFGSSKIMMDSPAQGSSLSGVHNVSGWFLDESGVSKVEVLVDGQVMGQATYGNARPDVQRAYPEYNNGYAGFQYSLDTNRLSNGVHTITVRGTGKNGKTVTLSGSTVTVSNAIAMMDTPTPNMQLSGIHNIVGWFLDASGVARVEVLVDGAVVGQAVYGDARPDVQRAYPQYKTGNAGYHYALDTKTISEGVHKVTIRGVGKNGETVTLPERTITVANVKGVLDNPVSNMTISGIHKIGGWFLDESGVAKVEVLVDGAAVGQAVYGQERPDVLRAYPQSKNGNAGYVYELNTMTLKEGKHNIAVRETSKTGRVTTLPAAPVTVTNTHSYIDAPDAKETISGNYTVSGWFLDRAGVGRVEVLIDGAMVGNAVYGQPRFDVQQVYPQYNNLNAGYRFVLDTKKFSNGNHTLTIRERGKNNRVVTLSNVPIVIANH